MKDICSNDGTVSKTDWDFMVKYCGSFKCKVFMGLLVASWEEVCGSVDTSVEGEGYIDQVG